MSVKRTLQTWKLSALTQLISALSAAVIQPFSPISGKINQPHMLNFLIPKGGNFLCLIIVVITIMKTT
jgi:hypothetical protein